MRRGLIAGRFMPPHQGHAFLVETALGLCDRLAILLLAEEGDPISEEQRAAWLGEMFPAATIITSAWDEAARMVLTHHPEPIDLIFACDQELTPLARELGARLVLIDPTHDVVPASSAAIRSDPLAHWRHIPPAVRPHYARTICLHGPESTGKSTLAPLLARHFDTIWVPEYGRVYCEQYGLDLSLEDLVAIGSTHAAMTRAALRQCNRRLILDTDPLMTAAWARMLFGRSDPRLEDFGETADFYLLLDIDMPWFDDGTRFFGGKERRRRFFDLSRDELEKRGLGYAVIGGGREERLDQALSAIRAAGLG